MNYFDNDINNPSDEKEKTDAGVAPEEPAEKDDNSEEDEKTKKKHDKHEKDGKSELKKLKRELDDTKKLLSGKESEFAELSDRYSRVLAEYDNYRKRTQKERDNIYTDAYADAVSLILPVYDTALMAAEYADNGSGKVSEGVALLVKSFSDTLEKMDIKEIPALGEKFNPEYHNAVMHIEDDSYGENEIVEVFQKGFTRGGKTIRYAMVKVAN
ncbi:MAG: nucleotide exchange factor GrpE [Clostridia bacterium]|nr:nucleotide exchange factor GrpE [Clostridia bacterium]